MTIPEVGARVRLHPRAGGDIFDLALEGRVATVEAIEHDLEDSVHVVVTLEDDPGRDLGDARILGHRFFFSPDEVEPLPAAYDGDRPVQRVLVAGIGNVFMADDGFGVEVVARLAQRPQPAGVEVVDFGIRGMDLAYALQRDYAAVLLIDATPRGGEPGTLYLIEPEIDEGEPPVLDVHAMDPAKVLRFARSLGMPAERRTLVVGCEPAVRMRGDEDEVVAELSEPVRAAVDDAVELVESLVTESLETEEVRR